MNPTDPNQPSDTQSQLTDDATQQNSVQQDQQVAPSADTQAQPVVEDSTQQDTAQPDQQVTQSSDPQVPPVVDAATQQDSVQQDQQTAQQQLQDMQSQQPTISQDQQAESTTQPSDVSSDTQLPASPQNVDAAPAPQPEQGVQPAGGTPQPENGAPKGDYVTNVGRSMVDLLTDISLSDELTKIVADTMRLPTTKVTEVLEGLLDKVDNEQVTEAELALIITAPVVDEEQEKNNAS